MSSREQFEAWLSSEYPWGNEALDKAFFSGNDDNGYYTGGDFIYDGSSCADALFWAWRGWQESHKQGKAKCAALAADNDTAMAALKQADEVVKSAYEKYVALADENMALKSARQNAMTLPETPATDAFLAEVRAQGVEMYADNLDSSADDAERDGFDDAVKFLRSESSGVRLFAAQLRKGASA